MPVAFKVGYLPAGYRLTTVVADTTLSTVMFAPAAGGSPAETIGIKMRLAPHPTGLFDTGEATCVDAHNLVDGRAAAGGSCNLDFDAGRGVVAVVAHAGVTVDEIRRILAGIRPAYMNGSSTWYQVDDAIPTSALPPAR